MADPAAAEPSLLWYLLGVPASVIFYGRFYVQWIVSELRRKSVMPIAFWYMSSLGSLMLLIYGVATTSALGTLSHCFNISIYSRNLIHIWRERGKLSPALNIGVHVFVATVILMAVGVTAWTWRSVYDNVRSGPAGEMEKTAFWLGIGVLGQALFGMRFFVQWIATERRKKSVVPTAFWWLSLVASALMFASFTREREWVYALGIAATAFIYARNLWLIYVYGNEEAGVGE
ncbi:MAG: lipid-A-disaccharide synthase N-terminal domain-containing protein [Candidatus Hydrogenedentota bacterium]